MLALQNWKLSSLLNRSVLNSTALIGALITSGCIDSSSGPDSYTYFTFEGETAFCNDDEYVFDETSMTNFECVEPVYLSFDEFKISAKYIDTELQKVDKPVKLYAFNDRLYSVDHLKGIAVWALNSDQTEQIGYIEIPNVSDIAIRTNDRDQQDYLYANSYTDLVQINLNDLYADPVRITNMFTVELDELVPELPQAVYFLRSKIDATNGYIIGYKQVGSTNTVIFGD